MSITIDLKQSSKLDYLHGFTAAHTQDGQGVPIRRMEPTSHRRITHRVRLLLRQTKFLTAGRSQDHLARARNIITECKEATR